MTTPYDAAFVRDTAHFSKIYYGASIAALCSLAVRKGYSLVASNSAGNNAFFVRNDLLGSLPVLSPTQAYRRAQFREYHDEKGQLTFDDFDSRLRKISHLSLHDLKTNTVAKIADIPGILTLVDRARSIMHSVTTKTALVTGGYGFLGRAVAHKLKRQGYRVVGVGHGRWASARSSWRMDSMYG